MKKIAIFLVRIYQLLLSPITGRYHCRFVPTCSQYMIEAIEKKGLLKGLFLGTLRLSKCHPFYKKNSGEILFDPVEKNG
jgi:putative membrane protein insertion efficiency factor